MRRCFGAPQNLVLLALVAAYFLQVVTPLRLHFDSIVLLSSAETAARGGGFLFHGQPTVFPPGYPALLALLMRLHIAYVWVLISINIVFLLIGLLALRFLLHPAILEKQASVSTVCIFTLLSTVVIGDFTIPLTDCCFFGVAMCSLAVMNSAYSRLTARKVALSIALVVISICIRRIGVALIPPLLWMISAQAEARLFVRHASTGIKVARVAIIASVVVTITWVVYKTSTLQDGLKELRLSGVDKLVHLPIWRLTELGEMTANTPSVVLSPAVITSLLPFIGIVTASLIVAGMILHRKQFGVVDVFFVSYVAGILEWPFYSPRFWLPVLPLLIVYAGMPLKRLLRRDVHGSRLTFYAALVATTAVATLFALAGASLLAFTTAISHPLVPPQFSHL
jgi:hypothetical protein